MAFCIGFGVDIYYIGQYWRVDPTLSGGTAETLQCDSGLLHGMRSVCAMPFVRTGVGVAAVGPPKQGGGRPAGALEFRV